MLRIWSINYFLPLQTTSFANRQPDRLFRRQKLLFLPLTFERLPHLRKSMHLLVPLWNSGELSFGLRIL